MLWSQTSLSPNLFNRFSWDRGLAPLGGQAAKNRFVTLKRSRLSCKLLHMQLGIKKYTWVVGKKTKTFYKNLNIGRSSVRVNVYIKSHKPTCKTGFYYFCHSRNFLAGFVSQNSHTANSYLHFFLYFVLP